MNRRTFVGSLTAGLALQAVPATLMANSLFFDLPKRPTEARLNMVAELIRNGSLGTPQRLAISRRYSPEVTSTLTLRTMARQDLDLAARLLGTNLLIDPDTLLVDSPASLFGSYSASFNRAGMALTWQGLACIDCRAAQPSSTLLIMGSQGVLQMAMEVGSYQLVNLKGQVVRTNCGAVAQLNGSARRGWLGHRSV